MGREESREKEGRISSPTIVQAVSGSQKISLKTDKVESKG